MYNGAFVFLVAIIFGYTLNFPDGFWIGTAIGVLATVLTNTVWKKSKKKKS